VTSGEATRSDRARDPSSRGRYRAAPTNRAPGRRTHTTRSPQRREPAQRAAALAEQYGLRKVGTRPSLPRYVSQLWDRRHFILTLARAKAFSSSQNNFLGQLWLVLTPLLIAVVYMVVFGFILQTDRGAENFVAFLTTGLFLFMFSASTLTAGGKAISGQIGLVRGLHFPRAVLPIAIAMAEFVKVLPVLVVLFIIVFATGEPLTVRWLLLPVVVFFQYIFNTGCAFIAARLVVEARDVQNLIPLIVRFLRYTSGVFFNIAAYTSGVFGLILEYNPFAVYLSLARICLLESYAQDFNKPELWVAGGVWAVIGLVIGFVVFWQAEERYGRD